LYLHIQAVNDVSNDKIVIIGTGKNIEPSLTAMQLKIEQVGNNFKDYRVFIYENNSTDKTAELLKAWTHKNPKVTVMSETLSPEQLHARTRGHSVKNGSACRMELIAYGRNQVLAKALAAEFDDFKFVLVTDLDFLAGWTVKDVLKACAIKQPWDCLAANSIKLGWKGLHSAYYDRYAYRDKEFPLGPETIGSEFWRHLRKYPLIIEPDTGLKKVFSAFGGVAIYKRESLKGCEYCGYVTDDLKILLDRILNEKVSHDNPYYRTYVQLIDQQTTPLPVIFRANCGYDATVACEHVTLHASMILKGHDKIYVDSDLICRY
jgi:hypothetical protein